MNNNFCNNCGLRGGIYFINVSCQLLWLSLLVFHKNSNDEIMYLALLKKRYFRLCRFYRGKYSLNSKDYL